jgi:hypothetical protein
VPCLSASFFCVLLLCLEHGVGELAVRGAHGGVKDCGLLMYVGTVGQDHLAKNGHGLHEPRYVTKQCDHEASPLAR